MKTIKIVVLLGLLSICSTAFSDQEAEREAEKLLDTMGLEHAMTQSMSQIIDLQLQQNPALSPYKPVMIRFFNQYMSWESLKPDFVRIYSQAFTALELRDLNAFYATDTGKKTIELMPSLLAQGGQIGAARVQANMGELQAMITAEAERLSRLSEQ